MTVDLHIHAEYRIQYSGMQIVLPSFRRVSSELQNGAVPVCPSAVNISRDRDFVTFGAGQLH
jgi:hypothetical protein